MTKKVLAVVLSVLLLIGVMPFSAFAADVDSYQALVDEVAAFNAGNADVTITLTADVELQNTITIDTANGKTLTINGGKNITLASGVGSAFYVKQGSLILGKNTITGAPSNYKLIYLTGSTNPQDANYSNVTISGATINCTNGYAVMISANGNAAYGANITTKSGSTVYGYYGALYVNGSVKANASENIANVTVSGGTLKSTEDEGTAIYGAGYANYTIKSGTLTAATAAYFKAGNVTISGGTFNGKGAEKAYAPNGSGYEPTGEAVVFEANSGYAPVTSVSITGGTFNSTNADPIGTYANDTSVTAPDNFITGGTFKSAGAAADVSEYVNTEESGKVVDSNGKVVTALFEVNGVKYAHITEAVAAVPADGTATTITLLDDVSDSGYGGAKVQAGQNVIFDLDGHTWKLRGTVGSTGSVTNGFQFLDGSTVTIKNGTINASLSSIYTVIQNYGDLTIDHATINADFSQVNRTTVSSNNGSVVIKDSTIYMKSTQDSSQAISLTPGWSASYKNASMVIENSTITGAVDVDSQAANSTAALEFKGTTTLDGDIRVPENATGEFTVKNTGTGVEAPEGYKWDENGILTELQDTTVAVIGSTEYTTLEDAIAAVQNGETIKLAADVTVDNTIVINNGKAFTIDTNGKTISSAKRVFEIRNGGLTLAGNGTLETTAVSAIAVYGSADSSAADYATFTLGADTTISAPNGYGAMIGANNKAAYGAALNLNGTIYSKYGVYVNGTVQEPADKTNAAQVTINGTVTAGSENAAVYAAGYADWTVNEGAVIEGGSGIYIKSGNLTVNGGTITATGTKTDYAFNPNGANGTGDAIIIDSCGYPGNVPTVAINGGKITSANGKAVASYTKQDDPQYADATFEKVTNVIPATSTAVFSSDVSDLAAEGYKTVYDAEAGGYVVEEDTAVASVNGVKYDTLEAAVAAANSGDEITVLKDCEGNGIKINKDLTIDFGGHTYTVTGTPVGSTGTETNGFQLLRDNDITFKNGKIAGSSRTNSDLITLVQNYSNLTLDNMELSLEGQYYDQYTLGNNNGDIVIKDSTINAADFTWAGITDPSSVRAVAFDVCRYASYPSVSVTVTGNSVINGDIEVSASNNEAKDGLELTLQSGTINGNIKLTESAQAVIEAAPESAVITKAAAATAAAPEGYKWNEEGVLVLDATAELKGRSVSVADEASINYFVAVNDAYSEAYGDTAYVQFTVGGTTTKAMLKDAPTQDVNGVLCYKFSINVKISEMDKVVSAALYKNDGDASPVVFADYSINAYIAQAIDYFAGNENLVKVLKALRAYGSYMAVAFKGAEHFDAVTADEKAAIEAVNASDIESYNVDNKNLPSGIDFAAANLSVSDTLALNMYFNGDISAYNCKCLDKEITPSYDDQSGLYKAVIGGLGGSYIDNVFVLNIGEEYYVSYSPISYAYTYLTTVSSTNATANALRAMFAYAEASSAYFGR